MKLPVQSFPSLYPFNMLWKCPLNRNRRWFPCWWTGRPVVWWHSVNYIMPIWINVVRQAAITAKGWRSSTQDKDSRHAQQHFNKQININQAFQGWRSLWWKSRLHSFQLQHALCYRISTLLCFKHVLVQWDNSRAASKGWTGAFWISPQGCGCMVLRPKLPRHCQQNATSYLSITKYCKTTMDKQ